jgi:PAS domain S-box-containing protein
MKRVFTLQRTLSLHFLLVAILPALTFGLIAISLLHRDLQAGVYQQNQLFCEEIAVTTGLFLAEVEHDLATVARVIDAGTILRPEAVNAFLEAAVVRAGRFESIYLLDRSLRVTNLGLEVTAANQAVGQPGADFSRHPLFQRHGVFERPLWGDTFVAPDTGVPSVSLAMPVREGMLLGNVNLQFLGELTGRFSAGTADRHAIIDLAGNLVAASEPIAAMSGIDPRAHASITHALRGENQTMVERHQGRSLLESTATVAQTGWVVWVGVDLDHKMAAVDDVRNLLAGFMLLALFLGGSIALLDARRLFLPLADLNRRTAQIGAGIYDFQSIPSGLAEIDSLADSMQQMTLAIRDRERSLGDSEQRFRNLVNSIDGTVWEMDFDSGHYLFVSEQSATLFGYSPARWLNDPDFWLSRVHPEDRERAVLRGRLDFSVTTRHDHEYRFIAANGRVLWVRDLVNVIREDGQPRRLLGVMIDATVRKQAAAELERYRSDLEALVIQRTRELQAAQDELVQKERLAVLGQLTATVSHEIRNPLGTVSNALYLLRETLGDDCLERVERPLALAERGVLRCDGIISELLDFTRRRELQRVPVELDGWLAGLLDEMSWPAGLQRLQYLSSGVIVPIDPERLRRALINVIDNALQAMASLPQERQRLEIHTRSLETRCEIMVRDSGTGIPAEIMERIYEPMFSTKTFGVGLGVPIIRNIIADHGGGVDYQSTAGEGTTVTLWLPLRP